jgi:transcription elongation factor Elf1
MFMLSEGELNDQVKELLFKELKGFECPVCRHHEFAQLDIDDQNLRTNLMLYDGHDPVAKKHVALISIACTNCGHIEQFAEIPLRRRVLGAKVGDP